MLKTTEGRPCAGEDLPLITRRLQGLVADRPDLDADQILLLWNASSGEDQEDGRRCVQVLICNRDGSLAEMCANGLRSAAHWLFEIDRGAPPLERNNRQDLLSCARYYLRSQSGVYVSFVRGNEAGIALPPSRRVFKVSRMVGDNLFSGLPEGTFVDMGVPHLIFVVEDVDSFDLEAFSRLCEHPLFPGGTNASLIQRISGGLLRARVWERGVGPTGSCGTAAGAITQVMRNICPEHNAFCIQFPGGDLYTRIIDDPSKEDSLNRFILVSGPIRIESEGTIQ